MKISDGTADESADEFTNVAVYREVTKVETWLTTCTS